MATYLLFWLLGLVHGATFYKMYLDRKRDSSRPVSEAVEQKTFKLPANDQRDELRQWLRQNGRNV